MANTTSRILIELVAKADTTEFNKVIHGLTQVETKANDLATAIAKSGNTGGYGDTVQQLQKVVSGFSNAAETAGLLRRELQSLQEAKISGILTDEDARNAERHIGRLAEKLREFVALTERRIDGGLQRQLQDLTEVPCHYSHDASVALRRREQIAHAARRDYSIPPLSHGKSLGAPGAAPRLRLLG